MSEYKKLTEQDLAEVAKIVPRERILWADEINEEYSHDELTATPSYPDLVVRATSAEEISGVLKYANKEQKIGLNQALNDFLNMEDMYRHPDKIPEIQRKANKRQMKQDFWDVYAQGEMLDIFSGKKK